MKFRIPPLAYLLLFGTIAVVVDVYSPFDILMGEGRLMFSGLFVIAGMVVMLLGVREFRRHQTTVNPLSPEKANALVQSGIFRITRNPMYLGMLAVLAGVVISTQDAMAVLALVGFVVTLNRFQIRAEERALEQLFGEAYIGYCEQTRRWI
ncbi:MAG: membrane protein [Hyphobacterium sp.]|nr:MAG: membrane protein [Hyphobacterium sp.]